MNVFEERAQEALRRVIDPEIGINIVDLGLVHRVETSGHAMRVTLIATSPACPLGPHLTESAEAAIRQAVPEMETVEVNLVRDPPWTPERMSHATREQLGW